MGRPKHDLNFMTFDESKETWVMKPEVASGQMTVKIKPDIWWDQDKEQNPVLSYAKMRAKDLIRKQTKRAPCLRQN